MTQSICEQLERQLDSFDAAERRAALRQLLDMEKSGETAPPVSGSGVNLHCHTFFSYNAYGFSPSHFAWLAHRTGLAVAGIVDFDVLDGLGEFLEAGRISDLKACGGLETRVFVPEMADKEITSPGEPGITYFMGVGFPSSNLSGKAADFQQRLQQTAQRRNHGLMQRVNQYLQSVTLDYERDVLSLTPGGNATERHMCTAYARKAREVYPETDELTGFWSDKLSADPDAFQASLPEGGELLALIRARLMKRGGMGYVQPDAGSFPGMPETCEFILSSGGIPVHTWLDGTSAGESDIETLLSLSVKNGVAAVNIIPNRNYTPGVTNEKLVNLRSFVELAESLHLPIVVGTEMNGPGQKFVDNFQTDELAPLLPVFLKGARIVYAHSVLQQQCGLGYTTQWAKKNFAGTAGRNSFFEELGERLQPGREISLARFNENSKPGGIMAASSAPA